MTDTEQIAALRKALTGLIDEVYQIAEKQNYRDFNFDVCEAMRNARRVIVATRGGTD